MRDFDGQLSGLVTLTQLLSVPADRRDVTRLSQVATPAAYLAFTTLDEPLTVLRARLIADGGSGAGRPGRPAHRGLRPGAGPERRTGRLLTPADFAGPPSPASCGRPPPERGTFTLTTTGAAP